MQKENILLHHSSIIQQNFEFFQFAVNLFIYQSNGAQSPPHYYLPQGPFQPNPLFNDPIPVLNLSIFLILKTILIFNFLPFILLLIAV